jgi:hypothetical protein
LVAWRSNCRRRSYREDELLVIGVVRNGDLYIKSFLDHYRSLGRCGPDSRYGFKVNDEYKAYAKRLGNNTKIQFKTEAAHRFMGLERLIEDGFLIVSANYRQ